MTLSRISPYPMPFLCIKIVTSAVIVLLMASCATAPGKEAPELEQCNTAIDVLQQQIKSAGVGDAQHYQVEEFPSYRSSRFWSSLGGETRYVRDKMHKLGMSSLELEWKNLPQRNKNNFSQSTGFSNFQRFNQSCNHVLWQASIHKPLTQEQSKAPDSYSSCQRFFGIYALTRKLAAGSIAQYQTEMRERIEQFESHQLEQTTLYQPQNPATEIPPTLAGQWLTQAVQGNPLSVPMLPQQQLSQLARYHSPYFQIETLSDADKIGAAQWRDNNRHIDATKPTLYFYPSYIQYQNRRLLQLNYTAWFSERPKPSTYDWYGGKLDGLVWRVTLQNNGEVLFYDSIHPCGCYHTVHVPTTSPLWQQLNKSNREQSLEPILFFAIAMDPKESHSFLNPELTLNANEHYLLNVDLNSSSSIVNTKGDKTATVSYLLVDYNELRSLNHNGQHKSWFDDDGIIHESKRFERFFLWPLGVPSAGAMRQQGNHAIAFVGKRHFDEASVEQLLDLPDTVQTNPGPETNPASGLVPIRVD